MRRILIGLALAAGLALVLGGHFIAAPTDEPRDAARPAPGREEPRTALAAWMILAGAALVSVGAAGGVLGGGGDPAPSVLADATIATDLEPPAALPTAVVVPPRRGG